MADVAVVPGAYDSIGSSEAVFSSRFEEEEGWEGGDEESWEEEDEEWEDEEEDDDWDDDDDEWDDEEDEWSGDDEEEEEDF